MEIKVFDPAMCCSTGVCGPRVDPALAQFAADLEWLRSAGAKVRRFNLGQEPGEFVSSPAVATLLQQSGEAALPVVLVGEEVKSVGRYPSRDELTVWSEIGPHAKDDELAPVTAAPPSGNCGPRASSGCC